MKPKRLPHCSRFILIVANQHVMVCFNQAQKLEMNSLFQLF
ncbi:hypothetical protein PSE_3940 [Pseudovibrio sp. FO-BEG1]|nr:hypothetical protein PSE_3940 [Pseudovibrio sp. FO-BEG1]